MALTSGFYNSVNGDRKYNAEQLSSIFDGLINDGILYNVGNRFNITALSGNNIQIGSGRAWFNHTWIYNDSNYTISLEDSSTLLNRIDAVVLEINRNSDIRSSQIMIIKGEESSSPSNPSLIKNEYQNQYPLAYIYRKANSSSIAQEDITIKVGTEECPYVTGILPVEDIDKFIEEASSDIDFLKEETSRHTQEIEDRPTLTKTNELISASASTTVTNSTKNNPNGFVTKSITNASFSNDAMNINTGCKRFIVTGDDLGEAESYRHYYWYLCDTKTKMIVGVLYKVAKDYMDNDKYDVGKFNYGADLGDDIHFTVTSTGMKLSKGSSTTVSGKLYYMQI